MGDQEDEAHQQAGSQYPRESAGPRVLVCFLMSNELTMQSLSIIHRRRFLQTSAALGAAIAAGPLIARAAESASAPKKIKVGVLGCGSVSRMYFPNLAACPYVELVSACDKRSSRQSVGFSFSCAWLF
jgi:hypothetical protein